MREEKERMGEIENRETEGISRKKKGVAEVKKRKEQKNEDIWKTEKTERMKRV